MCTHVHCTAHRMCMCTACAPHVNAHAHAHAHDMCMSCDMCTALRTAGLHPRALYCRGWAERVARGADLRDRATLPAPHHALRALPLHLEPPPRPPPRVEGRAAPDEGDEDHGDRWRWDGDRALRQQPGGTGGRGDATHDPDPRAPPGRRRGGREADRGAAPLPAHRRKLTGHGGEPAAPL
eukprot:scaffold10086_cov60-Phaeocystis_antarctica.AAC.4